MTTASTTGTAAYATSSPASSEARAALGALRVLFGALAEADVRYCHWKSNARLDEALRGEGDVDLLVHRGDAPRFQAVLGRLGYKPLLGSGGPSVCHWYGVDGETGRFVHLHVYHRIVTGGTVLKNHHLPVEELLLGDRREMDGVPVPSRAAELVLFVVRKMLEYAVPIEALFLTREGGAVPAELRWLEEGVDDGAVEALLAAYLPAVEPALFRRCHAAMRSGSVLRRFLAARALAARLRPYTRSGHVAATLARAAGVARRIWRRARRRGPAAPLLSGGAVLAVVGPDGAGKSTLVRETAAWLGQVLPVAMIHAGKPPGSLLTLPARALLPAMRRLLPRYRGLVVESAGEPAPARLRSGRLFVVYAVRAVMLAWERRRLLAGAHRMATRGTIVLSDRYPTTQPDVPEGPALGFLAGDPSPFYRWLARLEERLYRSIPPADLVLYLDVPAEIACERNVSRNKPGPLKPSVYIRRRHARTAALDFGVMPVRRVRAVGGVEETFAVMRPIVWEAL
jgi:thymidylate kinase